MPCIGSLQRDLLYDELLSEVQALIDVYVDCDCLIGGDFNVDLDNRSNISAAVLKFIDHNHLHRCEQLFPTSERNTYINDASNTGSAIDYMLTSTIVKTIAFNILDLDINLSDHLPIMSVCTRDLSSKSVDCSCESQPTADVTHLRWDHAPLDLYYEHTRQLLQSVQFRLDSLIDRSATMDRDALIGIVDDIYHVVVDILRRSANSLVPSLKKSFYKYWWCQELDLLKDKAIVSCRKWKEAGKPRSGPYHSENKQDKILYKKTYQRGAI